MSESELIPDWSDVPEDDTVEAPDAGIEHEASVEEVEAQAGDAE